jgi:predicted ABC-type transport system involved in lysophospholipase L1 biosynthesis ATPase subunit
VARVRVSASEGRLAEPVVVVLEGKARDGVEPGTADGVTVLHASGSGDDTLLTITAGATGQVTLVSADRALCKQAEALGAGVARPGWLIDLLDA